MLKVVNHIEANRGKFNEGKHLKFPIASHPRGPYNHRIVDQNFNRLKMEVSKMRALPYFDVNAETTLQTDASKKGLCACIIQKGKVVCYASRALTKTEQNYQNLEREREEH